MARTLQDAFNQMIARKLIETVITRLKGVTPMFQGYKTYIIAAALVVLAALSALGFAVPGFEMEPGAAITMALGLIFSRNGAKTEVKKIVGG